jgi:glycosyltransferase involved in cell wall biosynthesis
MAAGTPVVTTDAGSLPEVVGDAAVVVPAGAADALRRALRVGLLFDARPEGEPGPSREDLIAAGRERARKFPVEVTADRVQSVLRRARESA